MKSSIRIIASIVIAFSLIVAYSNVGAQVFAQNPMVDPAQNQTSTQGQTSPQNQTVAADIGQDQTFLVNQTTIPAEQTSVTVNQTTEPIQGQPGILQPLDNLTVQPQTPNLSGIEEETTLQATGPAITTIVNQTTVPFNQTMIETENMTNSQQQQNQTAQQPQQQQQQNQTAQQPQGPLEQLGESVGNLIPGQ